MSEDQARFTAKSDSNLLNRQSHLVEQPSHSEASRNANYASCTLTDIGLRYYCAQRVYLNMVDSQCRV